MELLFLGLIIQICSVVVIALTPNNRYASLVSHIMLIAGLIAGLTFSFLNLIQFSNFTILSGYNRFIRIDALSNYFLIIIQLVAIPTTIYSYSYLNHYIEKGKKIRSNLVFFVLMLISTQLVVIANHAIFFLVCWELMSTSAYLGMTFEKEKRDVQTGSFYFLIVSHVIIFLLYIFFLLLHNQSNSWSFFCFSQD